MLGPARVAGKAAVRRPPATPMARRQVRPEHGNRMSTLRRREHDLILERVEAKRAEVERHAQRSAIDKFNISHALGFVFRVIEENSIEALVSDAVREAVDAEIQGLLDLGAFSLEEVREWDDVTAQDPTALWCSSRFVLGEKNAESRDPAMRRIKARMVAGGHNVRSAQGGRVREQLNHAVPAGLAAVRLVHAHAGCYADGKTKAGDVTQAYVKADLLGPDESLLSTCRLPSLS